MVLPIVRKLENFFKSAAEGDLLPCDSDLSQMSAGDIIMTARPSDHRDHQGQVGFLPALNDLP